MYCFLRKFLYVCLVFIFAMPLKGQEMQTKNLIPPVLMADVAIPPSYTLTNGARHLNIYASALGHPYLISSTFPTGNQVVINGEKFKDVILNFDVHNMILIIEYDFERLGKQRYVPPVNSVESFTIYGRKFVRLSKVPGGDSKFYEEIFSGSYRAYNLYTKKYEVNRNNSQQYAFSDLTKSMYVYYNDHFFRYRNNRGFVKSFPHNIQPQIKQYIRENKLKVRNEGLFGMQELLEYINAL